MGWIIKRNEDGAYVARSGSRSSYTRDIRLARRFPSEAAAKAECCGNEHAARLEHELVG